MPRPPATRPRQAPELIEDEIDDGWRLHWEADPRKPKLRVPGSARFDAPQGEYAVTYANHDRKGYGCFAEGYGDKHSIAPNQAERKLSRLRSQAPLKLLAMDDGGVLAALELDLRISASVDYERTMLWGKSVHDWYDDADGIRYVGRHATTKLNYCFFLDRCADKLEFERRGTLVELEDHVLRAADAYSLAPRLFEPRDPSFPL